MSSNMVTADSKRIDWMITLVPFILIMALAVYLFIFPEQANGVISQVRFFFGDTVGLYYLVIGVGVLLVSLFLSFSKYGDIVLGEPDEKPQYNFFTWGSMMFTCGLAADILFYSFAEWVMGVGHVRDESAHRGDGIDRGVGRRFPAVSLELHSLGFLSGTRGSFRIHAACAQAQQAEIQ